MIDPRLHAALIPFVAAFGAIIGSFLNACIHRIPRGISLSNPKRSFCPKCDRQIPWFENLPLLSWLVLRGKCAGCKAPISARYFFVELLVTLLFVAVWMWFGKTDWQLALVYIFLLVLFVLATFIDFEHYIIPDRVTIGGTAAGLVLSLLVPQMMGVGSPLKALGLSFLGAVVGFGILFAVVELGKLAFGRKHIRYEKPVPFELKRYAGEAGDEGESEEEEKSWMIVIDGEELHWDELFYRPNDRLILECTKVVLNGKSERGDREVTVWGDRVEMPDKSHPLDKIKAFMGKAASVVIPREAMGFGDVKFMAAIGAFLGWKGVVFTIFAGSILGTVSAVLAKICGKSEWSSRIPFGPYLALGATIWMFVGARLVAWYLNAITGAGY